MARILVADDASFMRQMIREIVKEGGHEVVAEASDGIEAIERVFKTDPGHYLSVMARVIPSEVIHTPGGYDDLSDSELDALILETARRIVADAGNEGQKALPAPLPD